MVYSTRSLRSERPYSGKEDPIAYIVSAMLDFGAIPVLSSRRNPQQEPRIIFDTLGVLKRSQQPLYETRAHFLEFAP